MEKLAQIHDREIKFEVYDTSKNWIAEFPTENWCLIIIAEEENKNYFDEIIRKAIDRNVGYIFSVGKQHDLIHDMADEELVFRDVDIEDHYLPKHMIMTAGVENFEDGIWQGIYITHQYETEIDQVIILDVTKKAFEKTADLVRQFESGYVPE
ncbi:hypothetical protein IVB69_01945 [Flavobacterium sp. J49]|uniref:hypothetical protein n=1 Tax=Flavobacterium sp. J49 TaxID=2718534 RepID=UPI001594BC81|nr:hypothetical protein [Flavobacterium sp. J49]MBF6640233.1 hypothetical protein [Flavobacterium sp. J49]NIC01478.1 hypothetical protein [Flavobacterium sp. J49]